MGLQLMRQLLLRIGVLLAIIFKLPVMKKAQGGLLRLRVLGAIIFNLPALEKARGVLVRLRVLVAIIFNLPASVKAKGVLLRMRVLLAISFNLPASVQAQGVLLRSRVLLATIFNLPASVKAKGVFVRLRVMVAIIFNLPESVQAQGTLLRIGILLAIIFNLSSSVKAQGDLLITPRRVVFEGGSKLQEINLANSGSDTARYVISLVEVRMNANGTFEFINAPDSGQQFASNFLRFFPHSVTLPPNEAQVVKVQLQHTADLDTGEYRSHIYFRAVPKQQPLGEDKQLDSPQTISIKLTPVFGITIPVIVRVGKNTTTASMSDVSLTMEDTIPRLNVTFHREGNMSVYGDVSVDHISPSGKVTPIGSLKGVAVYTPNKARQLHVALAKTSGVNYHSGKLRVYYQEMPTQLNAKVEVLATSEIQLN